MWRAMSFDPHVPGIAEATWESVLADASHWNPGPGPIFIVSPHPDDEVFGAGGLIALFAATHDMTIISVTDGERAYDDSSDLAVTRSAELVQAIGCLTAASVRIVRLSLPDSSVIHCLDRLRAALFDNLPTNCTLVVPFEDDGHPDHNAVGRLGLEVAKHLGIPTIRYPIWRWHNGDVDQMATKRWGKVPLTVHAHEAKMKAMRCFQSQLAPPRCKPVVPPHVLAYFERTFEAFIL